MSDQLPIDPDDINITMTEISSCERRLVFKVPARLVKRFHKKLKKSGNDASIEVASLELRKFCIEQGIKRFEIRPIWGPITTPNSGEETPIIRLGNDFTLSIDVDQRPEIEWPDFSTFEIVRPVREITDSMIDDEMDEQCRDAGKRIPLKDEIQIGDEISSRITLSEQGSKEPLYIQDNITVRIPNEAGTTIIFGMPVDGIGDELVGSSVGKTIKVETLVPDDYDDPTLRGITVIVELEILEAFRVELATVEEVVEQYGSPSEAILRQQIRTALDSKSKRDQQSAISLQIFKQLRDQLDLPLPSWMVTAYKGFMVSAAKDAMQQRGCSEEAIRIRLEERDDLLEKIGIELARKRALVNLIARHLKVKIDESTILDQIAELAEARGQRPEELRKEIMATDKLQSVSIAALEKKSVELLIKQMNLTDMPADEWVASRKATA